MKPDSSILLCAVAFGLAACGSSEPVAPDNGLEPILAQVVRYRTVTNGEPKSAVDVNGGVRSVSIRVTTPALCATLVSASANQLSGEINVVANVSGNPAALCTPIPANAVIDYVGTVRVLAAGPYRVKVFQAEGSGDAKFIGSEVVNVVGGEN